MEKQISGEKKGGTPEKSQRQVSLVNNNYPCVICHGLEVSDSSDKFDVERHNNPQSIPVKNNRNS